MKYKVCALCLTLVMVMSAVFFSACGKESEQPETPPEEEQATEGLKYTPLYGEDGTAIGYTVGAGEAVNEENIVIPAKHDGLPVLRIGLPGDFFEPIYEPDTDYLRGHYPTDKLQEEYTAYVEGLGYDPQDLKQDAELNAKVTISFHQQYTFMYCKAKTINIPNGVTELGFQTLLASDIESLYLPESVTKFENEFPNGLVSFCNKLTKIEVSEKNPVYRSEGNCIIETTTKTVVAGCKASVIPEGTLTIGSRAFSGIGYDGSLDGMFGITGGTGGTEDSGVAEFKEIGIPKSVTAIQYYAFFQCFELERILYAGTVEEWNGIEKERGWRESTSFDEVVCTNGTLTGADIG